MNEPKKESSWKLSTFLWVLMVAVVIGGLFYLAWYEWAHRFEEHNNLAHPKPNASAVEKTSNDPAERTHFLHVYIHEDRNVNQCDPCEKKKSAHKKLRHKEMKSVPKAEPKAEEPVKALASAPDFYDKAVMPKSWVTEPEEEVVPEQPRVGRKILVIRQQPMMPYYGGYSSGYYQPQVVYGSQYVPPPQTVFVPAPPVIVPAPSVVTPAGGYKPQGNTGGHSPGGTTGTAL